MNLDITRYLFTSRPDCSSALIKQEYVDKNKEEREGDIR
jgi:hypothetical protein